MNHAVNQFSPRKKGIKQKGLYVDEYTLDPANGDFVKEQWVDNFATDKSVETKFVL